MLLPRRFEAALGYMHEDGEERWGSMSISKIALHDRILYAAFLKDITQLRLTDIERRLLSMSVNVTSSATCIVDANSYLIYVNDGLIRLLGVDPERGRGGDPAPVSQSRLAHRLFQGH